MKMSLFKLFATTIIIMHHLIIGSMNCHGQTKLNLAEQLYVQNFIKSNYIDILLCQETKIDNDTF